MALLLFFVSGCGMTWKHGTATHPILTDVSFQGNHHVGDSELANVIDTRTTSRSPFAHSWRFDAGTFATDQQRIVRHLQARGFYDARIVGWRLSRGFWGVGRARLVVVVDEGRPSKVRALSLQGFDTLPPSDKEFVFKELPLHTGGRFQEQDYDLTKQLIAERLQVRGYALSSVEGVATVRPDAQAVDITIAADTGNRYRLDAVSVQGTRDARARPILWASGLKPGQLYDVHRIDAAQTSIYDTGAFSAVQVHLGDPRGDRLPATIDVREAKRQSVQIGAGGGVDRIRQDLQAKVAYKNRDLLGGLDLLEITLLGGYSVLPTVYRPQRTGPFWGIDAQFHRPNFLREAWSLSAHAAYQRSVEEYYDSDEAQGTVGLDHGWRGGFSAGASYGLDLYRLTDVQIAPSANPGGAAPSDGTLDRISAISEHCPTPCTISFVSPHGLWDHRDDVVEPRRGWFLNADVEKGGGPLLGGTHDYSKWVPEARVYATPNVGLQRVTFAARVRTGWIFPVNGPSPVVRRFFAGGPDSNRGYATRQLGPMIHDASGRPVPLGGDHLVESNFETRVWLTQKFSGVAFFDAGQVDFRRNGIEPRELAYAIGPGLRYLSPIGPVRVDLGYRVWAPRQEYLDTPGQFVSQPRVAFHVGLGEAF